MAIVLKLLQDIFEPPPFRCTIRAHVRERRYATIAAHSLEGHMRSFVRSLVLIVSALLIRSTAASAQATLELEDFLTMPMTGSVDSKGSNDVLLSRVNTLREEAGGSSRLFISDLNGPLYIVDKQTKKFSVYLDFNGNDGKNGLFHRLTIAQGYGNGLNGFYLDPD